MHIKLIAAAIFCVCLSACGSHTEAQLQAMSAVAQGALLIDVRSQPEFGSGHLEGALHIPHTQIVEGLSKLRVPKDQPVVLYCRTGNRSGQAQISLQQVGYQQVTNAGDYQSLTSAVAAIEAGELD